MRALALAGRLLPLVGAGVSAAYIHTLFGVVTAVFTALYTAFIAIREGLALYEKFEAKKAARKSPRTKSDE